MEIKTKYGRTNFDTLLTMAPYLPVCIINQTWTVAMLADQGPVAVGALHRVTHRPSSKLLLSYRS